MEHPLLRPFRLRDFVWGLRGSDEPLFQLHHEFTGHFDQANVRYCYDSLYVDNSPVFVNLQQCFPAKPNTGTPTFVAEQQIDGSGAPGAISVYYDDISVAFY